METATAEFGALCEAVVFLKYFKDLPDPRQRGKVIYPLDEILLLLLLAVLAGSEAITDIARFGEKKLDPAQFQRCFVAWVAAMTGVPADAIAIDGKTSRRSYQKKGAKRRSIWF